jgi:anti-sigma B factor antagonist
MSATPTPTPSRSLTIDHNVSPDGIPTLVCGGRLTFETWELLKRDVKSLSPQNKRLLVDMGGVNFVDSAGLGGLLGVYVSAKSDGCHLELVNVHPHLRDLLNITRLTSVFEGNS